MFFCGKRPSVCLAQTPREGYINASDAGAGFTKSSEVVRKLRLPFTGGPGNSLTSILPNLEPLAKTRRVIYYHQSGSGRSDLIKDGERLLITKHVQDL